MAAAAAAEEEGEAAGEEGEGAPQPAPLADVAAAAADAAAAEAAVAAGGGGAEEEGEEEDADPRPLMIVVVNAQGCVPPRRELREGVLRCERLRGVRVVTRPMTVTLTLTPPAPDTFDEAGAARPPAGPPAPVELPSPVDLVLDGCTCVVLESEAKLGLAEERGGLGRLPACLAPGGDLEAHLAAAAGAGFTGVLLLAEGGPIFAGNLLAGMPEVVRRGAAAGVAITLLTTEAEQMPVR